MSLDTLIARHDGHQAIIPRKATIERRILDALDGRELTAEEVAAVSGVSLNNARSRLTELKAKGAVETAGRRLSPITGIHTAIWRIRKDDNT